MIPITVVNAFVRDDNKLSGNPAAVCIHCPEKNNIGSTLSTEHMQAIAAQMNLSETVFLLPPPDKKTCDFTIRWFTPAVEVALCGHATMAAAHTLVTTTTLFPSDRDTIVLDSPKSGTLRVKVTRGTCPDGSDNTYTLDFPVWRVRTFGEVHDGKSLREWKQIVARCLGCSPAEVRDVLEHPSEPLKKLYAVLEREATVRSLINRTSEVRALKELGYASLTISAAVEHGQQQSAPCDIVARHFASPIGIAEDPVTGSAHCALISYWSKVLGKAEITSHQVSQRGGVLRVRLDNDNGRVFICGRAATFLKGYLPATLSMSKL
eukprot:PhM_4_TR17030/c1_g1_i1/m.94618